jgi:Protein of unknown function (DUF3000)
MSSPGRGAPGLARPGSEPYPEPPGIFRSAVADLEAGRDRQIALRPELVFEDVPAPKRLAAHAAALAVTVQTGHPAAAEIASGRLVLLYEPGGQPGWAGPFRLVAQIQAELDPEIAADPLIGTVGWSWLTEALDARTAGYAAPSGTVTRVVTEGFGAKQDQQALTEFELRASWSPATPGAGAGPPGLAGHVSAWCDAICASAGLPPPGQNVTALRPTAWNGAQPDRAAHEPHDAHEAPSARPDGRATRPGSVR